MRTRRTGPRCAVWISSVVSRPDGRTTRRRVAPWKRVADHVDIERVDVERRAGRRRTVDRDALRPQQHGQPRAGAAPQRARDEASERRVDGLGPGDGRLEQVGAADEARDESVGRTIVERRRRVDLHEPAAAHDGDAIAERQRLVLVVRDQQRRDALVALQRADLVAQRDARPGVERGQRLVEQERARLEHQRARQRHALLLAAGELARQPVRQRRQSHALQHRARAPAPLRLVDAAHAQRIRDVLPHAHRREQRVALEHDTARALARRQSR